ncbi:MAG: DUF2892 domain-containing protein [Chitinophagaceae bacterium]|nr:DUF2892 domain-containing protein [Chitinophagaceae bacterium]
MKINMGSTDRILRLIIAAIIATLYFTGTISGVLGMILLALGGIFVMTAFLKFCPLYLPFGINTNKDKK